MVVLPASGWEIMAKVLRVATFSAIKLDIVVKICGNGVAHGGELRIVSIVAD